MDRFFEFMHGKAQDKLILMIVLAFGGLCFVVVRKIVSIADTRSMHKLIRSLQSKPSLAKELCASLDIPYGEKLNFNKDAFTALRRYLSSITSAGHYTILFALAVDDQTFLVLTQLSYVDYDINVIGSASDTVKKSFQKFVFFHDSGKNKLDVLSNIYSDTTDKFQKEEFLRVVFRGKLD